MKQLVALVICCVVLATLAGCRLPSPEVTSPVSSSMEVLIEGDGEFPEFLVGTWQANEDGWEFVFEPNGTISSVVISMGRVRMMPGQTTTVSMKKGGKGVFEPGEWLVHYIPADRQLTVKISLKNFRAELGKDVLEGQSTDIFVGKVSEDGSFWAADWNGFPTYTAHTAEHPNFELSEDPVYGLSKTLFFEKVTNLK